MRRTPLVASSLLVAGLLYFGSSSPGRAQPSRIFRIDRIDTQEINSPEYEVKRVRFEGRTTKQWFQIRTEYTTRPDWIDQADFRYYALLEGKPQEPGDSPFTLLRGDVSYVNIERGRHESVVYMHPSTTRRFGDVERVAVLVYVRGQLVGMASDPESQQRWWEQLTPQDGFILNRLETPFAMINFDNYEAIKAGGTRR